MVHYVYRLVLGNYLASQQDPSQKTLVAAMLISTPWNVFKAMDSLEKPFLNLMINRYLTYGFFSAINRYYIGGGVIKKIYHY
jgi:predicted alpha/beta-fold hydrolase